jgi:hypothetical protein
MKRTIIFSIMMMAVFGAKAQLKVDSIGKVLVGTTSSDYKLTVNGGNNGIYCLANPTSTAFPTTNTAIRGYAMHLGSEYTIGLYGRATGNSQQGTVCGVAGEAYGGRYGQNYGVFGHIISVDYGAGIYGTTHTSCIGETLDGCYAGYFEGNVKITGSLSGVLLSGATSSLSPSNVTPQSAKNDIAVTPLIKGLEPSTYYLSYSKRNAAENHGERLLDQDIDVKDYNQSEQQIMSKRHYALNADQLEEVFPDLVYENEDGSKSINYVEMVPILVQAINELNAKIEVLEGGSAAKKVASRATGIEETGDNVTLLSLGQNRPNPFGTTTSIEVSIPNEVQKAFIYVYDLQGKKVDQVDIIARGKQTIQLNAAALTDGMYLYSLIADGKVVETRRMIVEK